MAMAAGTKIEQAIEALYAAPSGEFVKRRDALARDLRKDGDREAADRVKALRKPTVAAWAVNGLARKEKMRLRGLLTAGERLREAHEEALSEGLTPALAEARDAERAAIEELARAAQALLEGEGHPASEAVLDRIRETLHASVVDEDLRERVRAGRLEKEEKATGFGFAPAGGAPGTSRRPARRQEAGRAERERERKAREARERKRREAAKRLEEAREGAAEAEREVGRAARELERAERGLARRRASVERAERDLDALSD
jgi:hypothetical protein